MIRSPAMRYAVCNEMFGAMEFSRAAELAARHGFHGLEVAPFTVFGDFAPDAIRSGIATIRKGLDNAGLAFAGLHWLFVKPDGLHVTARDPAVRRRSWDHLDLLIDIAGDLGGGNLIFGSPQQRASQGIPMPEAMGYFLDGLAAAGDRAAALSSRVLIEPLAFADTDVVNTLAEAEGIVTMLDNPGLGTMFDFHNTVDETESWDRLITRYATSIHHVHLNTMAGLWPTPDSVPDYQASFSALSKNGYEGWLSLEIFTVPEDPARVLDETMHCIRDLTEA